MVSKRIKWVDFSKGLAILLVIIGHTVNNPIVRGIIFSVHMPLFFLLSGYTSKPVKSLKDYTLKAKKMSVSLLLPAYIVYFARLPLYMILFDRSYNIGQVLFTALLSSGTSGQFMGISADAFGMMWFMVVLFGVRNIYDLIILRFGTSKILTPSLVLVSILGMIIGHNMYLPFSFDLILTSLILFHFGRLMKNVDFFKIKWYVFISSTVIYGIGMGVCAFSSYGYLELAARRFPLYPLSFIIAIAGCFCIFIVSAWLEKNNIIVAIYEKICFLGKKSMIIYIAHAFDSVFYDLYKEKLPVILCLIIRLGIDIIIMMIYVNIKKRVQSDERKI